MNKILWVLLGAVALTLVSYKAHSEIRYSDFKDVLSALLNISAIVFAIIGAWIAIIYPKAIGHTFGVENSFKDIKEKQKDTMYLANLVEIVLTSAVVLMSVLIIQFLYPILRGSGYLGLNIDYVKTLAFFIVALLTILQLQAVFRVILANYFFLSKLHQKNIKDEIDRLHQ